MTDKKNSTTKALLTANDMCDYLNIGISTAYKLLNTEGFPTVQICSRKFANKELLDQWLLEQAKTKGESENER